ncbi:unnamed protein product [Amoebophrya sp. A120]|nr:unnamed protein product [Amoebophrya sp. A120]|eukprot:GSA120T00022683001.1
MNMITDTLLRQAGKCSFPCSSTYFVRCFLFFLLSSDRVISEYSLRVTANNKNSVTQEHSSGRPLGRGKEKVISRPRRSSLLASGSGGQDGKKAKNIRDVLLRPSIKPEPPTLAPLSLLERKRTSKTKEGCVSVEVDEGKNATAGTNGSSAELATTSSSSSSSAAPEGEDETSQDVGTSEESSTSSSTDVVTCTRISVGASAHASASSPPEVFQDAFNVVFVPYNTAAYEKAGTSWIEYIETLKDELVKLPQFQQEASHVNLFRVDEMKDAVPFVSGTDTGAIAQKTNCSYNPEHIPTSGAWTIEEKQQSYHVTCSDWNEVYTFARDSGCHATGQALTVGLVVPVEEMKEQTNLYAIGLFYTHVFNNATKVVRQQYLCPPEYHDEWNPMECKDKAGNDQWITQEIEFDASDRDIVRDESKSWSMFLLNSDPAGKLRSLADQAALAAHEIGHSTFELDHDAEGQTEFLMTPAENTAAGMEFSETSILNMCCMFHREFSVDGVRKVLPDYCAGKETEMNVRCVASKKAHWEGIWEDFVL